MHKVYGVVDLVKPYLAPPQKNVAPQMLPQIAGPGAAPGNKRHLQEIMFFADAFTEKISSPR